MLVILSSKSVIIFLMMTAIQIIPGFCLANRKIEMDYWETERKIKQDPTYRANLPTFNNETESILDSRPDNALCRKHLNSLTEQTGSQIDDRVMSPWKYVINYDSRRSHDDRYIMDTECVCRGCYAPSGLNSQGKWEFVYTEQLHSVPLTMKRHVQMMDGSYRFVKVRIGCHCIYPVGRVNRFQVSDDEWLLDLNW